MFSIGFVVLRFAVQRMIKYTGYGNAAGWLADRGLMGVPAPPVSGQDDDSDTNSDTDEYTAAKHE